MSFMPEGAMDKMNEAITNFTAKFAAFMVLGFFETGINQAKAELESAPEDDPDQLLALPVPDWTIKSGWMTKEGGNWTNWKKRFFVAKNKAEDFIIEYYDNEKCLPGGKKGFINCAGYRATKDGSKKPHGITLTPWDDERRAWYLQCDTAEEQTEWMSVFENATWHARPTGDPDPMVKADPTP
jgi:hypothetical protein